MATMFACYGGFTNVGRGVISFCDEAPDSDVVGAFLARRGEAMTESPAGSLRDTAALANCYTETSVWQYERGLLLLEVAEPSDRQRILDLGCGTGRLSTELARRVAPSGQVIAIDPDPVRLEEARKNSPPDLENIVFEQASGEDIGLVCDSSIDLVYSNYAIHWMLGISGVFDEIQRVLRPGGRLVAEFLGEPISIVTDLLLMMPTGKKIMAENIFLDESEWRRVIDAHSFDILELGWPCFDLQYGDLQSLFRWLEATSQGAFDRRKLEPQDRAMLGEKFPGAISCPCQALRMILRWLG